MSKEPNNEASDCMNRFGKHWFLCVENTAKTSPMDIDEFCQLLNVVCDKYNLKWCQAVWNEDLMKRLPTPPAGEEVK
jgi:hypothetical protein